MRALKLSRKRIGWLLAVVLAVAMAWLQLMPRTTHGYIVCDEQSAGQESDPCASTQTIELKYGFPFTYSSYYEERPVPEDANLSYESKSEGSFFVQLLLFNISLAAFIVWLPVGWATFNKK